MESRTQGIPSARGGGRMKLVVLLVSAVAALAADAPQVIYSKTFTGGTSPYVRVSLEADGAAAYNETKDPDNSEKVRIELRRARQIFELADRLEHFQKPLESGLKVAYMGQTTFRWEQDAEQHEAGFNYSTSEDARALAVHFDSIVESVRLLVEFRRAIKYDRLGVNAVVNRAAVLWDNKRLAATADFLPLFDQVSKNEAFMHMARDKATRLADAIRAAGN